jgi:hypothetical protein
MKNLMDLHEGNLLWWIWEKYFWNPAFLSFELLGLAWPCINHHKIVFLLGIFLYPAGLSPIFLKLE